MTDAEKIAASLSEAQRRALSEIPHDGSFTPALTGFQWPTLAVLKSKRLILSHGYGKNALHWISRFGLSVRAIIQGETA